MPNASVSSIHPAPAPGTVAIREGLVAIKGALNRVSADLSADVEKIDGLPFTGENVAALIGTHLAMTDVLSNLTNQLCDFVALLSTSLDLVQRDVTRIDQAVRNIDGRLSDAEGL